MADINLKRFVNINIKQHVFSAVKGTRDTVVLLTTEAFSSTDLISSYADAQVALASCPNALGYAKIYFDNGGNNLLVIGNATLTKAGIDSILATLANEYIVIAFAGDKTNRETIYGTMKEVAQGRQVQKESATSIDSAYGISEKIILASTSVLSDTSEVNNFAVKYIADDSTLEADHSGAEMAIAAYLSQINVYGVDTVHDYAFTREIFDWNAEDITDSQYATIIQNNMNVTILLANAYRNCGGNCKDGLDLVNSYVRIILHQTLTDRLISVLTQKIKNAAGIGKIYTAMIQELENYRTCGYLATDKFWIDEDLVVTYNGISYTVIEKGTQLQNGYKAVVLPLSSLSEQDKADHKAPPIIVVLADQYGIRVINVTGDII